MSTVSEHEHGWCTESSHRTLDGVVRYVRCVLCGARRIDLAADSWTVPAAASSVLGDDVERTDLVVEQRW